MHRAWLFLLVMTLTAIPALGWQDGAAPVQNGPSGKTPVTPQPDKDGVYSVGDGIVPPAILHGELADYPANAPQDLELPVNCMLSAVIGVDGAPSNIQLDRGCDATFNAAAVDAVKRSLYQAGSLNDRPVPVLVHLRVEFQSPLIPHAPKLVLHYRDGGPGASRRVDVQPKVIHSVEAEYSEQARRAGKSGIVVVALTVSEEGLPIDVHVVRGVGMGLDEQAVKAVQQYRFKPAILDGKPVATPISVEVSFKLYTRGDR